MYLWFFTANILICYQHSLELKPVCFGAIKVLSKKGIVIDFIPRTSFEHNWRPSWILTTLVICKYFILFVILKNICYRVKFWISLIIRIEIRNVLFLRWVGEGGWWGWWGAALWIFMKGNLSSYICLSLNADSQKIIFWFRVMIFVFMSIKFASIKKFTVPLPQYRYFRKNHVQ